MTVFSEKLARLIETFQRAADTDLARISVALDRSQHRVVHSVGSGGSAVAAEYLARCRTTLGHGSTIVQTPMQFVLDQPSIRDRDVWLFSAGSNNPDIAAALQRALSGRAASIHLVTSRRDGESALRAEREASCSVHVLPVADEKDGFLATHSLAASIAAMLFASGDLAGTSPTALRHDFLAHAATELSDERRKAAAATGIEATCKDALILLHDPQLATVATLIETSMWETGIIPVQRTDFRNFAHGRHVWLARRAGRSAILALTGAESLSTWEAIERQLPSSVLSTTMRFGNAGRFSVAVGVISGLVVIEALGAGAGIDPGRPGAGPFARPIYEDRSLERMARRLGPEVRHKWAAHMREDDTSRSDVSICVKGEGKFDNLVRSTFGGLVLDYDGTVVDTDARRAPPCAAIVAELVRLVEGGLRLGIATGRGGSAGAMLREVLPPETHRQILVGYYNGSYVRTLDIDIDDEPAPEDRDIVETRAWLVTRVCMRPGKPFPEGRAQLTIQHENLADPSSFLAIAERCPAVADGRVRICSSQHSFDLITRTATKNAVVKKIEERIERPDASVLTIGDSGGPGGNDHELLACRNGISVGTVCGKLEGTWTLFGEHLTGPAALLRILKSLRRRDHDGFDLDPSALRGVE